MPKTLYYAHDPMCSWCWAFRPSLNVLIEKLPKEINIIRLLGGLAPDSNISMPENIREYVLQNWRAIEKKVPKTKFNYDFWEYCKPRRSTYPACRAVIAARKQKNKFDAAMTLAIQKAYYLQARNPSDYETLIELAGEIGADKNKFSKDVTSPNIDKILKEEIQQSESLNLKSLPSLLFINGEKKIKIEPDYLDAEVMLNKIKLLK
ncbi:MAG: DsbA family protein [Pseudomonadota bacterium]|nr:DsbA family protein [Pseudomonadota bacterium]